MSTKEQKLEYKRRYREKNKEKISEYNRLHKEEAKTRSRKSTLKEHGVTLEEYEILFKQQKGKCAICGTHQDKLKLTLAVDHDHLNNKVRGLLCNTCNRGIGYLHDDINLLETAIIYLRK